jgi:uncharacterized protein YjbI with pentapeptide repeats
MKVYKPLHLSFNQKVLEQNNEFHFIASVTSGVRLSTGEPLLETEFLKDAILNMGSKPLPDLGMPKPRGEFLVSGNYYAPGGEAVTGGEVIARVGDQEKNLLVFGDRQWIAGIPSQPENFTTMPIEYGLAFGGNNLDTNMEGKGYQGEVLPNIEMPQQLLTSPNSKIEPAGFSVLDPACAQRRRYLGTYDDQYLQKYFPGYPEDFDWHYFMSAPKDQWIEDFYQGDEAFEFHNMHPEMARINGSLPGFKARCFYTQTTEASQQLKELSLNLDTLWFLPAADLCLLIWRGGKDVVDDEAEQIENILLAFESSTESNRDLAYYQSALDLRVNSDDVLLNNFNTGDLIPADIKCAMQIMQEDALSGGDQSPLSANLTAKTDAIKEMVKEKTDEVIENGKQNLNTISGSEFENNIDLEKLLNKPAEVLQDPDVVALNQKLESLLPGITSGDPKKIDLTKFSFDKIEKIMAEVKLLTDKKSQLAMDEVKKATDQLSKVSDSGIADAVNSMEVDGVESDEFRQLLEDVNKPHTEEASPLPRMNAELIHAQFSEMNPQTIGMMQQLQSMQAAGVENEFTQNLEKMIAESINQNDDSLKQSLAEAEASFRETYFMGAHYMQKCSSPHQETLEEVADRFIRLVSEGKSVASSDWACIDLSGRVLDNIDLSDCYLEQVDFSGASLINANLTGAILARANLNNADLSAANFEGANMGTVTAHHANFTNANIKSAKLSKADFTGAIFSHCHIEDVESLELVLNQADFTGATISGMKFIDLQIKGARFSKANISQFMVLQCQLHDIDFKEAILPGTLWADSVLEHVNFDAADLTKNCFVATEPELSSMAEVSFAGSRLDSANLQGMNMPRSNLSNASMVAAIFNGANLFSSNLSNANAQQAQFRKANMEHCDMHGINLMEGSLAKARLSGASIYESNLYSVDFLRSVVGGTDLAGCLLENTLLQEWKPS